MVTSLLSEKTAWTLYYSVGIYGGIGQVYRATSIAPPVFQRTGVALNTLHYANDVKTFRRGGKTWYLMALYIERVATDSRPHHSPTALSNDGVQFGPEQALFGGAYPQDQFLVTPAFVTSGNSILGVLYGANPTDLLSATDQIFARWLQKKSSDQRFVGRAAGNTRGLWPGQAVAPDDHRNVPGDNRGVCRRWCDAVRGRTREPERRNGLPTRTYL